MKVITDWVWNVWTRWMRLFCAHPQNRLEYMATGFRCGRCGQEWKGG